MMKFLSRFLSFAFALLFCVPAFAATSCYSPAELHAEQLLRLHSELMVITVSCRLGSEGQSLVPAYTGFTKAHIGVLHEAEQTMIRYYKASYSGTPVSHLDKLRTRLANEYGQRIADVSAPVFCEQYRNMVLDYNDMSPPKLQEAVMYMVDTEKSYDPACSAPATQSAMREE